MNRVQVVRLNGGPFHGATREIPPLTSSLRVPYPDPNQPNGIGWGHYKPLGPETDFVWTWVGDEAPSALVLG